MKKRNSVHRKILLFSRCDLVHFYGSMHPILNKNFDVVHLAYSEKEGKILKEKYQIKDVYIFKSLVENLLNRNEYLKVSSDFLDDFIVTNTNSRFNLNSAIQSDRTFSKLEYSCCLILAKVYYLFWDEFLRSHEVDIVIHEPNSLYFNQIGSAVCNSIGSEFLTFIQVYGNKQFNFLIVHADDGTIYVKNELTNKLDMDHRVNQFLMEFHKDSKPLMSYLTKKNKNYIHKIFYFSKFLIGLVKDYLFTYFSSLRFKFTLIDHVEIYHAKVKNYLQMIRNNYYYNFSITYSNPDFKEKYFYYPIHLEPEAVVLYWGDGLYSNQVKLIQNIASQLPPETYLYVKDHPHAGSYRDSIDYYRIQSVPNIRLLNPSISGKTIIAESQGVITLNGTSGFEALLLKKQVYTFGNCFYNICPKVKKIHNIKDLRNEIYAQQEEFDFENHELMSFIKMYIGNVEEGFVSYFNNRSLRLGINDKKNCEAIAKILIKRFS